MYMTGLIGTQTGTLGPTNTYGSGEFMGATGRHLETANYLFADGHVKALKGQTVSPGNAAAAARLRAALSADDAARAGRRPHLWRRHDDRR